MHENELEGNTGALRRLTGSNYAKAAIFCDFLLVIQKVKMRFLHTWVSLKCVANLQQPLWIYCPGHGAAKAMRGQIVWHFNFAVFTWTIMKTVKERFLCIDTSYN